MTAKFAEAAFGGQGFPLVVVSLPNIQERDEVRVFVDELLMDLFDALLIFFRIFSGILDGETGGDD